MGRFRNYCIICMGSIDGFRDEIISMAAREPNFLWPDGGGIMISTFISLGEPSELSEFFKGRKRTFLLFDLDKEYSGYNFTNRKIHNGLFGFLDLLDLENMTNDFINEVNPNNTTPSLIDDFMGTGTTETLVISDAEIAKMSSKEKHDYIDLIIGKDGKSLSEEDKVLLQKLSK